LRARRVPRLLVDVHVAHGVDRDVVPDADPTGRHEQGGAFGSVEDRHHHSHRRVRHPTIMPDAWPMRQAWHAAGRACAAPDAPPAGTPTRTAGGRLRLLPGNGPCAHHAPPTGYASSIPACRPDGQARPGVPLPPARPALSPRATPPATGP